MTQADIPPGGEGEIEVTFSTGGKKGTQTKSISITSNDPNTPTAKVKVRALIEVEFDFESRSLDFGRVKLDEPVSKSTKLVIKDPTKASLTELSSSNPLVEVKQLASEVSESGETKVEIEITLLPGYPLGRMRETITAHSNLESKPKATIRISASVQGEVELIPETLRFDRYPRNDEKTSKSQKLQIVNKSPDHDLHILSVEDPDGRLALELKTLQGGQRYEVAATLIEDAFGEGTYYKGTIQIKTDNPKQETITVNYNIYSR